MLGRKLRMLSPDAALVKERIGPFVRCFGAIRT
jgi:hypothetical protein